MVLRLEHVLVLSALLFAIGVYGALSRRNAVAILLAVELMLNAVNVAFVGFARFVGPAHLAGQVFAIFVITVAAAEAALALAIVVMLYRQRRSVDIEEISLLRW
jgi:NADH:ubiquinone oxidoreductase subunit K